MTEETLFLLALDKPADERATFLDSACMGDDTLRLRVEELLRAHHAPSDFLDEPAIRPERFDGWNGELGAWDGNETRSVSAAEGLGSWVGPYRLIEPLGEGGMGVVFKAEQAHPVQRTVALKIIKPGMDSRAIIARFEAERQVLARMDHPNIAKVLDAGATASERPYFVMELVHGVPITKYCDEHSYTARQRLELFIPVCQAVQHAHQKGIIHRDLKPSNVLVTQYDGKPVAKVIDFGIARATERNATVQTEAGMLVGTPAYMSPEQADATSQDVDTRSDIYSLGVVLYELLSHETPFATRAADAPIYEVLRMIREVDPPAPSSRSKAAKEISGELDWITLKCLEKDRSRRYDTAAALAEDIRRFLEDEPVLAGPPSKTYRMRKFVRRNRGKVLAASIILLTLLGGIVGTSINAVRANRERDDKNTALTAETVALKQAMAALRSLSDDVVERLMGRQVRLSKEDREFLNKIVAQYEAVAELRGEGEESRSIRAVGNLRVADLRRKLGEHTAALAAYEQSREMYRQLVAEFPSDSGYRRNLATSHNNLGLLLRVLGRRDDSISEYRQAVPVFEKLVSEFPTIPAYRVDLASVCDNWSAVCEELGKREEAEALRKKCLTVRRQLVAEFPAVPDYRHHLGQSQLNLGVLLKNSGKTAAAEAEYREAIAIWTPLVAEFPNVPDYRRDLAVGHNNLGNLLKALEKRAEAESELRRSLVHRKQLTADFPTIPAFRADLASTHSNLALLFRELQRYSDAETETGHAISLRKQLVADFPTNTQYAIELAGTCANFGDLHLALDRPFESLDWCRQAIQTLTPIVRKEPLLVTARTFLKYAHRNHAQALMRLDRHADALIDWDRALELDDGSDRRRYRLYRATCLARQDSAKAVAEAEDVIGPADTAAELFLGAAQVYAAASTQARTSLEGQKCADRAAELLHRARQGGYFKNAARVATLRQDHELAPLAERQDFQRLLLDIESQIPSADDAKMP